MCPAPCWVLCSGRGVQSGSYPSHSHPHTQGNHSLVGKFQSLSLLPKAAEVRGKIHGSPSILPTPWAPPLVSELSGGESDFGQASCVASEGDPLECPGTHWTGSSVRAGNRSVFPAASQHLVEPVFTQQAVRDISSIHGRASA